jgi:hypothetical protein
MKGLTDDKAEYNHKLLLAVFPVSFFLISAGFFCLSSQRELLVDGVFLRISKSSQHDT